jgi:hypothetical protein
MAHRVVTCSFAPGYMGGLTGRAMLSALTCENSS